MQSLCPAWLSALWTCLEVGGQLEPCLMLGQGRVKLTTALSHRAELYISPDQSLLYHGYGADVTLSELDSSFCKTQETF